VFRRYGSRPIVKIFMRETSIMYSANKTSRVILPLRVVRYNVVGVLFGRMFVIFSSTLQCSGKTVRGKPYRGVAPPSQAYRKRGFLGDPSEIRKNFLTSVTVPVRSDRTR
jgi:hypothetical protein